MEEYKIGNLLDKIFDQVICKWRLHVRLTMASEHSTYHRISHDTILPDLWFNGMNSHYNCLSYFPHCPFPSIKANPSYTQCCTWASTTGLTAVSKFKPRLPAQWAVGTHRKGPSRMEKGTFRMNWPIRKNVSISKSNLAYRQHHYVKPIILFHFQ